MKSTISPNHTQIPNDYLDYFMEHLNGAEWKCLCYIARRTFGFQKRQDKISISQFVDGITSKEGIKLDGGTGLSKQSVISAIKVLVDVGILEKLVNTRGNKYQLVQKLDYLQVVQKLDSGSLKIRQQVVQKLDIQKKEKESIQKKDITTGKLVTEKEKTVTENSATVTEKSAINNEISEVISLMEKVDPKNKTYYGNKTQRNACKFLIETYSFGNVVKVVNLLPQTNTQEYFPRITSPYELQEKWQKLAIALSSAKRKDNELVNQMII